MGFRYILGRSGTGKTRQVMEEISHYAGDSSSNKLILLVPEQYTLKAEQELIGFLKVPGIMRVEVLSLTRLGERVLNEAGGAARSLLNEQGKNMVLRKIIDENSSQLQVYRKAAYQEGFVRQLSELLAEWKQYDLTPSDLKECSHDLHEDIVLRNKLQDSVLLFEGFNRFLKDRYLDLEDRELLIIERIIAAPFLKGARIWLDGLHVFTPLRLLMLEKLAEVATEVTITFTLDPNLDSRDRDLFDFPSGFYRRIREIARQLDLDQEVITLDSRKVISFRKPDLVHLEKELYAFPARIYSYNPEHIQLFAATNTYSEVENLAADILYKVREKGLRWRDIAVVCGDMDRYAHIIKRTFPRYGIPCFVDSKRDIMGHPLVEFILALMDIVQNGYRYQDVFRCLKTGLMGLDADQIELLENHVIRYGIRGQCWKQPFSNRNDGDIENLEQIESIRGYLVSTLEDLENSIKGQQPYAHFTKALLTFLEKMNIQQKLAQWIIKLQDSGHYEPVYESAQIWNIVVEIFEQMTEILGDQRGTLKEYNQVLRAGFASYEIGIIPTTLDQVLVGNVQRSRIGTVEVLYVIGVNDGVLPSPGTPPGLFLEEEKNRLLQNGLRWENTKQYAINEERFLLYSLLGKAKNYLYFSFSLADEEGRSLRPSLLIDRIRRLFPHLRPTSDIIMDQGQQLQRVAVPESTFQIMVEQIRRQLDGQGIEGFWWDVYKWYVNHPAWNSSLQMIQQAFFHSNQVYRNSQVNRLFGKPLRTSVSRLEQYSACPFAHFIRYGLKPVDRKQFSIEMPDIGDLFHQCLLEFSCRLDDQQLDWHSLDEEKSYRLADQVMEELVQQYGDGVFTSTYHYRYLSNRLKRINRRAVWTVAGHLQKGNFTPWGYEVWFGSGGSFPPIQIELADGSRMLLEGRVDRIDVLDQEDTRYIKIIDYKTGGREFVLSDIYYGLTLQLVLYMSAVLDSGGDNLRQVKPAGIFYFKIDDPLIQTDQMVAQVVQDKLRRQFRMKGLVLKDVNIIRSMDIELQGNSDVIPVSINKDQQLGKNSSVMDENEWNQLITHVKAKAQSVGKEIINGNISINPFKKEKEKACDYCRFSAICQFDPRFKDNNYRILKKINDQEIMRRIAEKRGGKDAGMD